METEYSKLNEESDLARLLQWRRIAVNYRDGRFGDEWRENLRFYLGDQYDLDETNKLALWRATAINNVIMPTIEQVHSLLTDDQTIAFVKRIADGSYQVEKLLDNILKHVWDDQKLQDKRALIEKDKLFFGIGITKVDYDEKNNSLLQISVNRVSPFNFYPDPLAKTVDDMEYVFERKRISKSALIDLYPDAYDEIIEQSGDAGNPIGEESEADLITSNSVISEAVYIWYCYFKDLTMLRKVIDSDEEDSEIAEVKKIKKMKRKYPKGRCIVVYGDTILEDVALKCGFPFVVETLMSVPDEFFGQSLITPMKDAQEELNNTKSMIIDNIKSNVNPIWLATEGVIDIDSFIPTPNSVVVMRNKQQDSFEKMPGIQLPGEVFNMVQTLRSEMMGSAGVSDVTFGAGAQSSRPGTVKANFNASITRIREMLRGSHRGISEIGKKIIEALQNYVPIDTQISLADRDDTVIDYSDSAIIEDTLKGINMPGVTKNLSVTNAIINESNPEFKKQLEQLIQAGQADDVLPEDELRKIVLGNGVSEFKNDIRTGKYNYCVSSHPLTITDPEQLMELFTMLLQYGNANPETGSPGIIDFEFVLQNINLPNKADLIRRLKKKEKMMQQAQQAQAQQGQQQRQGA